MSSNTTVRGQDDETATLPADAPERRAPLWVVVVALAVALVAGVLTVLAQIGGPVAAATSEHYDRLGDPLPQITADEPYRGEVVALDDRLEAVSLIFATYLDTIDCTLEARLTDAETGVEVGSSTLDCDDLEDNRLAEVVAVDPVEDSAGRTYDLTISLAPNSGDGPSVWTADTGEDTVITAYDPDTGAAGRVSEALDRMGVYGSFWSGPLGIIALVVFGAAAMVVLLLRPRWGLWAILALVLVRGLLWTALLPPLQGMDEGAHFSSVQFMATTGELPNRFEPGHPHTPYSASLQEASLGMNVTAIAPTDRPDYSDEAARALTEADADADTYTDGAGPAAGYPPGYYAPAVPFYLAAPDDTVDQVQAIRLWSVLLGMAAAALAWFFGREVFPRKPWAQAGLALAVALQPMVAHQFAIVNNDALVIASGFGALWIAARLTTRSRAPWLMLLAGAVVGLGLLGKPFAIAAAIPVAIGWVLGKVHGRVRDWKVLVGEPLLAAAGVALTYGAWLVLARLVGVATSNGFPTDPDAAASRGIRTYLSTQFGSNVAEFRNIWDHQFWGNFGWVNTPLPDVVYGALWRLEILIAVAVVAWLVVLPIRRMRTPESAQLDRLIAVCVGFIGGTLVMLYAIEYFYFAASGRTDLLQGRYALMTVPALLALPGLLTARLSRGRIGPTIPTLVLAFVVFLVHAAAVGVVLEHFYL
ncbi:DUF2142 domain-containing protein [Cellulomonas sp. Root137]|uniref:DUF2142 domain-containing protein n=1 Tax=Cellulomonas sp. Root137 TaxID=1736459 RepID=UPI0006F4CFD7|nr:DUF2142 domain-containing protein [Cellulomonas sp. Root137]KQY47489.1 hypothetical protein ASD18_09240 [Cellulomonas sp. Root137]